MTPCYTIKEDKKMANKKYAIKASEKTFIIRYIDKRFLDTASSWYTLDNIEELEQQWRNISKVNTPSIGV